MDAIINEPRASVENRPNRKIIVVKMFEFFTEFTLGRITNNPSPE